MELLAKLRNIERYENMSRQQVESVFATPSAPKPTLKPKPKPKSTSKAKKEIHLESKRKIRT